VNLGIVIVAWTHQSLGMFFRDRRSDYWFNNLGHEQSIAVHKYHPT
jgi:hypothetical protein